MATGLLAYTILVVNYGQLALSHSDLETFRCARLGACSINPVGIFMTTTEIVMDIQDITGLKQIKCTKSTNDMELSCGGIKGGWMMIAKVNTSQDDDCPEDKTSTAIV